VTVSSSIPALSSKEPDPSTVKMAINELKNLSRKERNNCIRKAKRKKSFGEI